MTNKLKTRDSNSREPNEADTTNRYWLRLFWLGLKLSVTYFFLTRDDPFFYQGF